MGRFEPSLKPEMAYLSGASKGSHLPSRVFRQSGINITDEDEREETEKEIKNLLEKILIRFPEGEKESRYNMIVSEFQKLKAKAHQLKLQNPDLSDYEAFAEILKND